VDRSASAFAIPVSLARNVLQQIIATGEVTRGWLGIEPIDLTAQLVRELSLERPEGVLIRGLQRNGPAARAGIMVKDVVLEIEGRATRDVPGLLTRIAELAPARTRSSRSGAMRVPSKVDVVPSGRGPNTGSSSARALQPMDRRAQSAPLRAGVRRDR
jgi:hypothetical protein